MPPSSTAKGIPREPLFSVESDLARIQLPALSETLRPTVAWVPADDSV